MMSPEQVIVEFDRALRTLFSAARSKRQIPGAGHPEAELNDEERAHVCGLMRVNHVGEICAQALYQGQALTSHEPSVRESLRGAADEETEHLAWTEQRLAELGGRKSLLNPLWYAGALSMGLLAGRLGDKWSLGFLAETERQVEAHLDGHLASLPEQDRRSREIVDQMRIDEIRHAESATRLGAAELPAPFKVAMKLAAKMMTETAYRV
jgi:ubiquinone biosynthesis monooxygenase Coq7